MKETDKKRKSQ